MKFKALFLISILSSSFLFGSTFNKKNDFQVWEHQQITWMPTPTTTLYFQTEFRWGDDASILYFSYLQGGISVSPCNWLTVAPGYRQGAALRPDHRRIPVYNPLLDATLKFKICNWTLEDRSRVQYLIPESGPDLWQYRNRIELFSPWKVGRYQFNPYLSEEMFFREYFGFAENRFAVVGRFTFSHLFQSDVMYMLRYIKFPTWRPTHVLRLCLYFDY